MAKDIDPFENAESLEKSLETPEVEEVSAEDIELAGMGFNLDKVDAYKRKNTIDSVIHQNYPKNDFLEWYLKACTTEELSILKEHLDKFRKNQVEKIEKAEVFEVIKQPSDDSVQGYIEKNAELIAEKDKLFKQIQVLQSERDQWKELTEKSDKYIGLTIQLIRIFKEQKIKAELTTEEIQLIKELSSK